MGGERLPRASKYQRVGNCLLLLRANPYFRALQSFGFISFIALVLVSCLNADCWPGSWLMYTIWYEGLKVSWNLETYDVGPQHSSLLVTKFDDQAVFSVAGPSWSDAVE
jgi:hypothetical protein